VTGLLSAPGPQQPFLGPGIRAGSGNWPHAADGRPSPRNRRGAC